MTSQQSIHDLGLGQPVTGDAYTPTGREPVDPQVTPKIGAGPDPSMNPVDHRGHAASDATVVGQEMPTTNPSVHVVLTNPPRPRSQTDTGLKPPTTATRNRADTNASTISSISSRSFTTSTTSSDMAEDDDDDADDYDPATGGDEKSCIKEKRVKEWTKRFHPHAGEELLCSESLKVPSRPRIPPC